MNLITKAIELLDALTLAVEQNQLELKVEEWKKLQGYVEMVNQFEPDLIDEDSLSSLAWAIIDAFQEIPILSKQFADKLKDIPKGRRTIETGIPLKPALDSQTDIPPLHNKTIRFSQLVEQYIQRQSKPPKKTGEAHVR